MRQRFQLPDVRRGLSEHEVEVDGRHRCALQRGGRIADQDDVEMQLLQRACDFPEKRLGVHSRSIAPALLLRTALEFPRFHSDDTVVWINLARLVAQLSDALHGSK